MSHDIEAAYAAAEVAAEWLRHPEQCFETAPAAAQLSAYAAREGRNSWPHADGVVELKVIGGSDFSVALEFKRQNEGLHGLLTAIGQAHAYLRKGYSGSVIVVPANYAAIGNAGAYLNDVLSLTSKSEAIGVYGYDPPNMAAASPFAGRLHLGRALRVDAAPAIQAATPLARTETQWAHVREGSTDPDALFKYLQSVKLLGGGATILDPAIPQPIGDAVQRVQPGADPRVFLSNAPGTAIADRAWRHFWFTQVLHAGAIAGWSNAGGVWTVNDATSSIVRFDGKQRKKFFVGRRDSIKNKLVARLNQGAIGEEQALDELVSNYHGRAHSYREDIDSGAEHLGFVDAGGRLTDYGYRFVDACERTGDPNNGIPRALFLTALLTEGGLGAFLHYVYRLSEEAFGVDPFRFTAQKNTGLAFNSQAYLVWIEGEMANRLHVMRKVSARGGVARKPFQAELALLRGLGIVSQKFRLGVGLVINWPALQEALDFSELATRPS
jgi:hypothetical protein